MEPKKQLPDEELKNALETHLKKYNCKRNLNQRLENAIKFENSATKKLCLIISKEIYEDDKNICSLFFNDRELSNDFLILLRKGIEEDIDFDTFINELINLSKILKFIYHTSINYYYLTSENKEKYFGENIELFLFKKKFKCEFLYTILFAIGEKNIRINYEYFIESIKKKYNDSKPFIDEFKKIFGDPSIAKEQLICDKNEKQLQKNENDDKENNDKDITSVSSKNGIQNLYENNNIKLFNPIEKVISENTMVNINTNNKEFNLINNSEKKEKSENKKNTNDKSLDNISSNIKINNGTISPKLISEVSGEEDESEINEKNCDNIKNNNNANNQQLNSKNNSEEEKFKNENNKEKISDNIKEEKSSRNELNSNDNTYENEKSKIENDNIEKIFVDYTVYNYLNGQYNVYQSEYIPVLSSLLKNYRIFKNKKKLYQYYNKYNYKNITYDYNRLNTTFNIKKIGYYKTFFDPEHKINDKTLEELIFDKLDLKIKMGDVKEYGYFCFQHPKIKKNVEAIYSTINPVHLYSYCKIEDLVDDYYFPDEYINQLYTKARAMTLEYFINISVFVEKYNVDQYPRIIYPFKNINIDNKYLNEVEIDGAFLVKKKFTINDRDFPFIFQNFLSFTGTNKCYDLNLKENLNAKDFEENDLCLLEIKTKFPDKDKDIKNPHSDTFPNTLEKMLDKLLVFEQLFRSLGVEYKRIRLILFYDLTKKKNYEEEIKRALTKFVKNNKELEYLNKTYFQVIYMNASYFVESLLTNSDKIKNLEGQIIDLKKNIEKKDDLMNKNQELIESQNKRIIELSLSNEKLLKKIQKLEISNKKLMERLEMKIDMLVKSEIEKKNLNKENTDADGADGDNK